MNADCEYISQGKVPGTLLIWEGMVTSHSCSFLNRNISSAFSVCDNKVYMIFFFYKRIKLKKIEDFFLSKCKNKRSS